MKDINKLINNVCIVLILLLFIFMFQLFIKKSNNLIDTNLIDTNLIDTNLIDTNIIPKNQQQTYETKYTHCHNINGCYKQCTNNYKYPQYCQYDQNSYNIDVCDNLENNTIIKNDIIQYPKLCNTRINIYNPL